MNYSSSNLELGNVYNKYISSSYNPNSQTLNMVNSLPQYSSANMNNLFLSNTPKTTQSYNKPKKHHIIVKPQEMITEPRYLIENVEQTPPPVKIKKSYKNPFNDENKDKILKKSRKVFDDIEIFKLVLSNYFLKIKRIQDKMMNDDFAKKFYEFRKRFYNSVDKTHDKLLETISKMREEFLIVKDNINNNLENNLIKCVHPNQKLQKTFKKYKKSVIKDANREELIIQKNTDKIIALASVIGDFDDEYESNNKK